MNVFGRGLGLYARVGSADKVLGGLGVSGDTSCADHMGSTTARIETWDGKQWVVNPEYFTADEAIIKPMVKAGAEKYLADKKLQRRPVSDCAS